MCAEPCKCPIRCIIESDKCLENIQAMLFWRRPVPMALFLVIAELLFVFIRKADLGFLSVAILCLTITALVELIVKVFGAVIEGFLFPPLEKKGEENEPNRIRSREEIKKLFKCECCKKDCAICEKLSDKTTVGMALRICVAFVAFLVFHCIGTFWPVVIVFHLAVLLPGILLHPSVYVHLEKHFEKIAEMCQKEKKE